MTWRHFSWCYLHGFLQSSIALIVEKLFITFISSMSLRLASPSFLPCMAPSTATQTHMHLKALKMDFKLFTLSPPPPPQQVCIGDYCHRNTVVCPQMILQTRCTRLQPGLDRFSGALDVSRLAGLFPPSFSELVFGCAPQAAAQHKGSYCQDLIQGLHSFSNMVG